MRGRFDHDELGVDPETEEEEIWDPRDPRICPRCEEPIEDCECEDEDEEEDLEEF